MSIQKHSEFIWAVKNEAFSAFHNELSVLGTQATQQVVLDNLQPFLVARQRRALELDQNYRQLIPYIVFFEDGEDGVRRYLAYGRSDVAGESRLAGNISIGYGGHTDIDDVVLGKGKSVDISKTIAVNVGRELEEELEFRDKETNGLNVIQIDDVRIVGLLIERVEKEPGRPIPVGNVHLGLVILMPIPKGSVAYNKEEEVAGLTNVGEPIALLSREELLSGKYEVEGWTKLVLLNDDMLSEALSRS